MRQVNEGLRASQRSYTQAQVGLGMDCIAPGFPAEIGTGAVANKLQVLRRNGTRWLKS
jgi:hypothetical protein